MKVSTCSITALILSAIPATAAMQRKLDGPYGEGETNCRAPTKPPSKSMSSKGMSSKSSMRNGRRNGSRTLRMNGNGKSGKGKSGDGKSGKGKGSAADPCADVEPIVAPVFFDTLATPNAIFGSGNDNGFFTCLRADALELCLRAKQRFPRANPNGVWSQGDGTYLVPNGDPCFNTPEAGFGFLMGYCASTPIWSFEWSINTNLNNGAPGRNIDAFEYELGMDADPACETDFDVLYPFVTNVAVPFWDHDFGDSTTGQGGGQEASTTAEFMMLMANNNVVQQSWNYEFFNNVGTNLFFFDPNTVGTYDIFLKAIDTSTECPQEYIVTIQVITDPAQTLYDGTRPFP